MAIAAEHLYESCTCTSGMRDGLRCADCGGRGIVPKGVKPTGGTIANDGDTADQDDDLANLSVADLRAKAKALGLSAGGTRDALTERIQEARAAADADDGDTADQDDESDELAEDETDH